MFYKKNGWTKDAYNGTEILSIELNSSVDAENAAIKLVGLSKQSPPVEVKAKNQILEISISQKVIFRKENVEKAIGEILSNL